MDEFVVVGRPAEGTDACTDFETIETMDKLGFHAASLEGVQSTRSLSNYIKVRNAANHEDHVKFFGVPSTALQIKDNLVFVELSNGLFDMTCSVLPLYVYLNNHKESVLASVVEEMTKFQSVEKKISLDLALGNAGVFAAVNQAVAQAEREMLAALFLGVGALCYLTFLSLRHSLVVLIPLVVVSAFGNAVMVILGIGLKVSTLPVVALGVGVGVDYGIYIFSRVKYHMGRGLILKESYELALREVGSGVIFTALTMTLAVATWIFSDLKFQADMGTMLAYMFLLNMVFAVTLAPAVAYWILPKTQVKLLDGSATAP
jgi:predicted RND superfamily exporter protein